MQNPLIRRLYLYLFSAVGLILITIGAVRLVTLGLKMYVFTAADQTYEYPNAPATTPDGKPLPTPDQGALQEYQRKTTTAQRENEAAGALAMIIIGLPVYLYHWRVIQKDKEKETVSL